MSPKRKSKIIEVPIDLLATPREGDTMLDRWWCVRDGRALFWQGNGGRGWTPQCNSDQRITESLRKMYPGATAVHIPIAYLGRWSDEWGHMLSKDLLEAGTLVPHPPPCDREGVS